MTAADLKRVPFRGTADRMITLGELVRPRRRPRARCSSRSRAASTATCGSPTRAAEVLAGYRGRVALMSFDPAPIAALRTLAPAPAARHRRRAALHASRMEPAVGAHQARARLFPARAAQPAAVHRLFGQGPAVGDPAAGAQRAAPAAADLDGAHRCGPRARGALRRPDDLRRISAIRPRYVHPMAATEITLKVVNAIGEVPADATGTPAPIRRPPAALADADGLKDQTITLSFRTIFCRRSNCPARSATAPAGSPCISSPRPAARIVGVVPCYAKSHSQGEYVFDHGWADAYERAGGDYYPKLQVAVPFTPGAGPPPAGAAGRARRRRAQRARRFTRRHLQALERLLGARHLPAPKTNGGCWASRGYLQRTHRQFHWINEGYDIVRRLPRRPLLAQAQDHPPRARGRAGERHHRRLADRLGPHRKRVGRVLRLLHGHRLAQMGPALSHALVLFHRRREDARPDPAGDGEAQRPLHRRRDQLHRLRHAVRPPLGLHRAACLPAFRGLLLPGHPVRHRAQARARRGRRRRLAQGHARLHADHDLFGALHRRSAAAARDRRFPQP